GGVGRAQPGRPAGRWRRRCPSIAAGNPHGAHRVRKCCRSGRRRVCRRFGTARRQHHRFYECEFGQYAKLLELLKQIAPRVARVAVLRNSTTAEVAHFAAIQAVAPSFAVEVIPVVAGAAGELENSMTAFARSPNGGLIAPNPGTTRSIRDLIIALAARHRLPAVYPFRGYVTEGGLISYGIDQAEPYRLAAGYVDR